MKLVQKNPCGGDFSIFLTPFFCPKFFCRSLPGAGKAVSALFPASHRTPYASRGWTPRGTREAYGVRPTCWRFGLAPNTDVERGEKETDRKMCKTWMDSREVARRKAQDVSFVPTAGKELKK